MQHMQRAPAARDRQRSGHRPSPFVERPEEDRFIWPGEVDVPVLTVEQLHWLLEGIDIGVVQRHPRRRYAHVG